MRWLKVSGLPTEWPEPIDAACRLDAAIAHIDKLREELEKKPAGSYPPMSDREQETYDFIRDNGPKTGKEIANHFGRNPRRLTRHCGRFVPVA